MPKRPLEVKCIPVRDLRRKLTDVGGVPVQEVNALKSVGAVRSMCTRMGIETMQTASGCVVPLFASAALEGEELQRELAAHRSEHIEKGTRKGHERNQRKMIAWWASRPEYTHLIEDEILADF